GCVAPCVRELNVVEVVLATFCDWNPMVNRRCHRVWVLVRPVDRLSAKSTVALTTTEQVRHGDGCRRQALEPEFPTLALVSLSAGLRTAGLWCVLRWRERLKTPHAFPRFYGSLWNPNGERTASAAELPRVIVLRPRPERRRASRTRHEFARAVTLESPVRVALRLRRIATAPTPAAHLQPM